jgi:quinol monooxygenase YgiN
VSLLGGANVIVNTTRITVTPGKRKEFFQTINQLVGSFKASKGCRAFGVYIDTCDENSSLLVSEWDTVGDLNNHLGSDDFAILHGAMAVLSTRVDEFRALIYSGNTQIANSPSFSVISRNKTDFYR